MSNQHRTDWYAAPTVTANMLHGIVNAVEQGLADEGMPLTEEQAAFLARALVQASA